MLYWALMFLVVALIAGVLGFTGVALAAAGIAKVLFVVFLVLFLVSLVAHLGGGRRSAELTRIKQQGLQKECLRAQSLIRRNFFSLFTCE